jgi:phosphoribosylaminoimidazole-succinocarboxamide synthase
MEDKTIQQQLAFVIGKTDFGEKEEFPDWDVYDNDTKMYAVATDHVHVHGRNIGTVPFKGQILATCTKIMCRVVAAKTDFVCQPHPNILVVKKTDAFPVSFMVYGYLTDPIWKQYSKGVRNYHGHELGQGLKKNQKLAEIIVVPLIDGKQTSKEMIFVEGLVDEEVYEEAEEICLDLFTGAVPHAKQNGMILAWASYVFGTDDGVLVLHRGFHVPGSTLYWFRKGYEEALKNDEEPKVFMMSTVHDWLAEAGWNEEGPAPPITDEIRVKAAKEYIALSTQFIGKELDLVLGDQLGKIEKVVGK